MTRVGTARKHPWPLYSLVTWLCWVLDWVQPDLATVAACVTERQLACPATALYWQT